MSEFEIIKCKSCNAPLVQLHGETLKKCIQCGHSFTQKISKKANLESMLEQVIEKSNQQTQTQTKNKKPTSQPKNSISKPKKPASIIGTIIKWYVILFIASSFLKGFF